MFLHARVCEIIVSLGSSDDAREVKARSPRRANWPRESGHSRGDQPAGCGLQEHFLAVFLHACVCEMVVSLGCSDDAREAEARSPRRANWPRESETEGTTDLWAVGFGSRFLWG